jgi:pilus assembly protein CpaC
MSFVRGVRTVGTFVTLFVTVALVGVPGQAQTAGALATLPALVVAVNHGRLLSVANLQRVVIAAPDIADVNVITRNEVMIIGKHVGETTLSLWSAVGRSDYRVAVVAVSSEELTRTLKAVVGEPGVRAEVVGDLVVLDGTVRTEAAREQAERIASGFGRQILNRLAVQQPTAQPAEVLGQALAVELRGYPVTITVTSPDTVRIDGLVETAYDAAKIESIAKTYFKNVVMTVRVRNPVEIQIATVVAEINRTALNDLGVQYGGGAPTSPFLGTPGVVNFGLFTAPNAVATELDTLIGQLHYLETRNAARILTNPRLVVMDGHVAKMLVGGEIPIPTVTQNGQTTITYQEFGVRLEFKPIAQPGAPINLDLLTEVSALDFADAIVANGFRIPALQTRRAETVVAMEPGQFLAIGGLIQNTVSKVITKLPLFGDIPILGELFRSTTFQRGESELVIFVAPSIVRPVSTAPPVPPMPDPDQLNP